MPTISPVSWALPLIGLLALVSSLGCQPQTGGLLNSDRKQLGPDGRRISGPRTNTPKEYLPYNSSGPGRIELKCGETWCPPQVGMLIFFAQEGRSDGLRLARRCTASIIAPNLILSNGHCDRTATSQGYFVTQDGQSHRVVGVEFKEFTPSKSESRPAQSSKRQELSSGRPDVAVFRLETSVTNIAPLKIAKGSQINFKSLTGYVVNANDAGEGYKVESVQCLIRYHGAAWPFFLEENPDVIFGFDCKTRPGNSGAPMFAPGIPEIQAVYFGYGNSELLIKALRNTKSDRPLFNYEKHWSMIAANVRCLNLPGTVPLDCIRADEEEANKRFQKSQEKIVDELRLRNLPEAHKFATHFEVYLYPLHFDERSSERGYEALYHPRCRLKGQRLRQISFPQEHLVTTFNEWAEPRLLVRDTKVTQAKIEDERNGIYQVFAHWQPAFAAIWNSGRNSKLVNEHPRKRYGTRFSIDLPECTR